MFCMTGIITLIKKIIFTFGRSDSDTKSSTGDPSFRLQAERCFNMTFAGYVILPFQKKSHISPKRFNKLLVLKSAI